MHAECALAPEVRQESCLQDIGCVAMYLARVPALHLVTSSMRIGCLLMELLLEKKSSPKSGKVVVTGTAAIYAVGLSRAER